MFNLSEEQEERAKRLHKESIVVDGASGVPAMNAGEHIYTPNMLKKATELVNKDAPARVIRRELERIQAEDLINGRSNIEQEWMELAGVDAHNWTIAPTVVPFDTALEFLTICQRKIDCLSYLVKAVTTEDIKQAKTQGKRAIIMFLQDSEYFGRDLDKLQILYDLGVRIIQLTYNLRNLIGSGCTERTDGGLSLFGIEVVKRMNELGILVDLSHCGYQTTMDALEFSSAPVAVTHSCSRKVYDHVRGKTDEQIEALAAKNGYFGVLAVPGFITDISQKEASLNDVLDHIDHVVGIMGTDKVGIGSDRFGVRPEFIVDKLKESALSSGWRKEHQVSPRANQQGFSDPRDWPNITRGLVSRGYNDDEIKGIIGGNFLRIFKEVVG